MMCPKCYGKGVLIVRHFCEEPGETKGSVSPFTITQRMNCPDCEGIGVLYCCEGDHKGELG
jgi:DnaJ-class molecular chaperone